MKKITIEGKEYEELEEFHIKEDVQTELAEVLTTKGYKLFKPIQTPQFKVGDRVEYFKALSGGLVERPKYKFTGDMIYRLLAPDTEYYDFRIIGDDGETYRFSLKEIGDYFKPYEKPKEGNNVYIIGYRGIYCDLWENDEMDNNFWNLGLAFKEKKQAEFARERLSKLF